MRIEYGFFICRQPISSIPKMLKAGKKLFKLIPPNNKKDVKWIWGVSKEQLYKGHSRQWIITSFSFKDILKVISFYRVYLTKAERKEDRSYYYKTSKGVI